MTAYLTAVVAGDRDTRYCAEGLVVGIAETAAVSWAAKADMPVVVARNPACSGQAGCTRKVIAERIRDFAAPGSHMLQGCTVRVDDVVCRHSAGVHSAVDCMVGVAEALGRDIRFQSSACEDFHTRLDIRLPPAAAPLLPLVARTDRIAIAANSAAAAAARIGQVGILHSVLAEVQADNCRTDRSDPVAEVGRIARCSDSMT